MINVKELSTNEKIITMELLWNELCYEDSVVPPKWHTRVLEQREKDLAAGKDEWMDWEQAKKELNHGV
jgi:hypothetical protein